MDLRILSHKIFSKCHNVMMWRGEIAIMSINVVTHTRQHPLLNVRNMIYNEFPSPLCFPSVSPIIGTIESLGGKFIININLRLKGLIL